MSGFTDCIDRHLANKKIKGRQAEEARERYQNLYDHYRADGHSESVAENMAAVEATRRTEIEARARIERRVAQIRAQIKWDEDLRSWRGDDIGNAPAATIDFDPKAKFGGYAAINDRVRKQLFSIISDMLAKYDSKVVGIVRPKAGLDNIVREIFGQGTGDGSAREMADAWKAAISFAVDRFNMAGGSLLERVDWHLPQFQARGAISKAGEAKWVDDHLNWLDWEKVRRPDGSRIPVAERADVLAKVYKTIKDDGANKIELGRTDGKAALGNQLEASRFLIYKDADSYMAMHTAYGEGSVYDAMLSHLDRMAHRIAMVERFGPNPALMRDYMMDAVKKLASERNLDVGKVEVQLDKFDTMFDIISRENMMIDSSRAGPFVATIRNIMTSAYLGSAVLAAIPGDHMTMKLTTAFNNMSYARTLGHYAKFFAGDKELAAALGVIAEDGVAQAYAKTRFGVIDQVAATGSAWSRRIQDTVMRASLMTPHTRAARNAFHAEFMSVLARESGKSFDDLSIKPMLERHGITAAEWDVMRQVTHFDHRGAKFIRPDDVLNSGLVRNDREAMKLADKFMVAMIDEGKMAVPDTTIAASAFLRGKSRPGTFSGEVLNSVAMFKNFAVTVMNTHGRRAMIEGTENGKWGYMAGMAVGLTAVGALTVQLRQITQGKDARSMDPTKNPLFWVDAMLAGGGLGIWGDFVFSDQNRYGGSPVETLAGPVTGLAGAALKLTTGNVREAIAGKNTNLPSEIVDFARRNTPGTSLWYARLILQRMAWDQMQKAADPKAYSKWRSQETKAAKEHAGQRFFWRPGDFSPSRAPSVSVK